MLFGAAEVLARPPLWIQELLKHTWHIRKASIIKIVVMARVDNIMLFVRSRVMGFVHCHEVNFSTKSGCKGCSKAVLDWPNKKQRTLYLLRHLRRCRKLLTGMQLWKPPLAQRRRPQTRKNLRAWVRIEGTSLCMLIGIKAGSAYEFWHSLMELACYIGYHELRSL